MTGISLLNWLLPLLYLAVLVDYGAAFFLRGKPDARKPWLAIVVVVHFLFLVLRAIHEGYPPLVSGYEVLSLVAFATAAVYWIVEAASHDRRTGVFVLLLVFLFQYTSSAFMAQTLAQPHVMDAAQSNWARLHVVPAMMAYTAMTIAGVYGMLHLLARRNLKQHRFGLLFDRLPSLGLLGKMTWQALLVGFAFMTITMATGPIIVHFTTAAEHTRIWDAKVGTKIVASSIAWLLYLAAVLGRLLRKWPDSRVSGVAVGGFLIIMAMLGISIVLS